MAWYTRYVPRGSAPSFTLPTWYNDVNWFNLSAYFTSTDHIDLTSSSYEEIDGSTQEDLFWVKTLWIDYATNLNIDLSAPFKPRHMQFLTIGTSSPNITVFDIHGNYVASTIDGFEHTAAMQNIILEMPSSYAGIGRILLQYPSNAYNFALTVRADLTPSNRVLNRDAFKDYTSAFGTSNFNLSTERLLLPSGLTSHFGYMNALAGKDLRVRHVKVTLTTEAFALIAFALYDTEGNILAGTAYSMTISAGTSSFIFALTNTGYDIGYFVFLKNTNDVISANILLSLPTWPFEANQNSTETRQWLTDILTTRTSEARVVLREQSRLSLMYNYFFRDASSYVLAKQLAERYAYSPFGVPLWTDAVLLTGLTLGQKTLVLSTINKEFFIGGWIIVYNGYEEYEVTLVTGITANSVTLEQPLERSYTSAWVIPFIVGELPSGITFTRGNTSGRNNANITVLSTYCYQYPEWATLPFTDLDGSIVTDSYGEILYPSPDKYNNIIILENATIISDNITENFNRDMVLYDNETGQIERINNEHFNRKQSMVLLAAKNQTELFLLRRQLDYLQGRYTPFWLPSLWKDVTLDGTLSLSAGESAFNVAYNQFSFTLPKYLRITGDASIIVQVLRITDNFDGTEHIVLTTAIPYAIINVIKIEILTLMRSNADVIEIQHVSKTLAKVSIPVIEVPV